MDQLIPGIAIVLLIGLFPVVVRLGVVMARKTTRYSNSNGEGQARNHQVAQGAVSRETASTRKGD